MYLAICIIVCRLETHTELRNRFVHVNKAINRPECGLCGLCTYITRIICMQIYFVYGFKPKKTRSTLLKPLSSAPIAPKLNPQSIHNSSTYFLSHSRLQSSINPHSSPPDISRLMLPPVVSHIPIVHHM